MSEKAPPKKPSVLGGLLSMAPLSMGVVKLLAVGVVLGILFMSAPDLFGVKSGTKRPPGAMEVTAATTSRDASPNEIGRLEQEMSRELESMLSLVQGAGRVTCQVSLKTGTRNVPVANSKTQETKTGEKAQDGSTRDSTTTTQDQTNVMVQEGNNQTLAVLQRIRPDVAGVLVVADGASDPVVRERLLKAAAVGMGVPTHRISVQAGPGGVR